MKITNLRTATNANQVSIVAEVIWQNGDRPNQDVYFATSTKYEDDVLTQS